jgi:hypothetical protein
MLFYCRSIRAMRMLSCYSLVSTAASSILSSKPPSLVSYIYITLKYPRHPHSPDLQSRPPTKHLLCRLVSTLHPHRTALQLTSFIHHRHHLHHSDNGIHPSRYPYSYSRSFFFPWPCCEVAVFQCKISRFFLLCSFGVDVHGRSRYAIVAILGAIHSQAI